jgi:prephenate dehydratase
VSPDATSRTSATRPRVAYLGPVGTFTEQVMLTQPDLAAAEHVPMPTMPDVLFAVHEGSAEYGVVAVENAIEGTVNIAVDTLAFDVDLRIVRELLLGVQMNLLAPTGVPLDAIKRIVSIPVAWAQCHQWLRSHLPDAELVASSSTASAAEAVSHSPERDLAAIANSRAAEVFGLDTIATDIEDHPENQTRFVVVARGGVPEPTGHDKTSIVVYQRADEPGSLLGILQEFAARQINLSLLLSRPTKSRLGDYCFLIDADGHVTDEVVADALRALKTRQADVKFLGSYPAAGEAAVASRAIVTDAAAAARDWVEALQSEVGDLR